MNITVSPLPRLDVREDDKLELKRSIFVDPESGLPGPKQMVTIARTMAAFMNADGGEIWVGVGDDGVIHGIGSDLAILHNQTSSVVAKGPSANDDGFHYGANIDQYELKIRAIAKAYLTQPAGDLIGTVIVQDIGSQKICKIAVKAAPKDKIVYFHDKRSGFVFVQEIYLRQGNQKNKLIGIDRDNFVRERLRNQLLNEWRTVSAGSATANAKIEQMIAKLEELGKAKIIGEAVVVEGAVTLGDPNFESIESPKGLVFDGQHVCDVKGWKGAYLALLDKLNEMDAAKFDDLPNDAYFRKYFVLPAPRARLSGYSTAPHKYGTSGKIRAKELGGKAYFTNPDYAVQRLLCRFGIEVGRVALRG